MQAIHWRHVVREPRDDFFRGSSALVNITINTPLEAEVFGRVNEDAEIAQIGQFWISQRKKPFHD